MTENIVTNKKYRILVDEVNDVWDRISFWSRASDVHFDDGTTAEMNRPINVLQRNKAYTVGTVVYEPTAPSWVLLRCTVAGTTAPVTPTTYQTITNPGTVITDGSAGAAKFTVYDVRPNSSMSESAYQIPTTNLVNNLNSQLTTDNGDKFQFAYDSVKEKYGFKVGESSEIIPFGQNIEPSSFNVVSTSTPYTIPSKNDGLYLIVAVAAGSDTGSGVSVHANIKVKASGSQSYVDAQLLTSFGAAGRYNTGGGDMGLEIAYAANCAIAILELDVGDTVQGVGTGDNAKVSTYVIKIGE